MVNRGIIIKMCQFVMWQHTIKFLLNDKWKEFVLGYICKRGLIKRLKLGKKSCILFFISHGKISSKLLVSMGVHLSHTGIDVHFVTF